MGARKVLIVEPIGLDIKTFLQPIDVAELFGNTRPLEIEIGIGRGGFLTDQATNRPKVNFLGLEQSRWYWKRASDRLRRKGCHNVRIFLAEALQFLGEFVKGGSVSAFHVYFPDPWPKNRHRKRRLIQPPFLDLAARLLIPGGHIQIVTDHREYYRQIERVVCDSQLEQRKYEPSYASIPGELVGSNFERKYRKEGRPIYALAAVRPRDQHEIQPVS